MQNTSYSHLVFGFLKKIIKTKCRFIIVIKSADIWNAAARSSVVTACT